MRDAGLAGLEHHRIADVRSRGERPGRTVRGQGPGRGDPVVAEQFLQPCPVRLPGPDQPGPALPPGPVGDDVGDGGRRGVVVEEMLQRQQAAPGALQDRDAACRSPAAVSGSMAAGTLLSTMNGSCRSGGRLRSPRAGRSRPRRTRAPG